VTGDAEFAKVIPVSLGHSRKVVRFQNGWSIPEELVDSKKVRGSAAGWVGGWNQ
jgi:hypothetical protein